MSSIFNVSTKKNSLVLVSPVEVRMVRSQSSSVISTVQLILLSHTKAA